MSNNSKKQYNNAFKFKVALAALRGDKTNAALCKEFGIHESQIARWKTTLRESGSELFLVCPYLFEGLTINKINQVWSTDLIYKDS